MAEPSVDLDRVVAEAVSAAAKVLAEADEVVVLAHLSPDADSLGSALALGMALRRRGTPVSVSFAVHGPDEPAPQSLAELDSESLLVPASAVPAAPAVVVACDTADQRRLGVLADRMDSAGTAILVDHHASNPGFGDIRVLDPRAEATVLLVRRIIGELEVPLDPAIGRCLYAGLATDTVGFRIGGPAPHRLAAELVEAGVEVEPLMRRLVDSHPFAWLAALGEILQAARLEPGERAGSGLAHATVPHEVVVRFRPEEIESVIDHVRTATEAEVTVVLKESAPGRWTVSMRSRGAVDVAMVALALGGGGHPKAAGFSRSGSRDEVLSAIRTALSHAP